MTDFSSFSQILRQRFEELAKHELYTVSVTGDEVWAAYLAAFPEGTNPIFRERTEHDCSCCRQFVRNLGNVVAIIDGAVHTIWDEQTAGYPYNEVSQTLGEMVVNSPITSLYRTPEAKFGQLKSNELMADGSVKVWNHFHSAVPAKIQCHNPAQVIGDFNTTVDMFKRALDELKADAVTTVIELSEENQLYRGEEFLPRVKAFYQLGLAYHSIAYESGRNAFLWSNATSSAARIRNSLIGTLLVNLSEGMELEHAVRAYEKQAAPENYQRTTALITPRMIDDAMKTIDLMGIRECLERRFAKLSDVSVNNVLWVDGSVQDKMKDGLASLLKESVAVLAPAKEVAVPISIADFMANVVPKATTISALVRNNLQKNLVSLTAPVHDWEASIFKWDNAFAWSYNGNLADSSMRRQVQELGGRVDGVLRFTHSWNYGKRNASLMDLHVFMPGSDVLVESPVNDFYGNDQRVGWNHRSHSRSGGIQDVDYTEAAAPGYVPVENITFPSLEKLKDGQYICKIHNWRLRSPTEGGFRAEIEFGGNLYQYELDRPLKNKEWVTVAVLTLKDGQFSIEHKLPSSVSSQNVWGIKTEQYVKVETLMYSPNHWDDKAIGNRHWLFMLEGCVNSEPTRGINNEYLDPALSKHRKVFEVIGAKTMCPPTAEQLSGLGFSSTQRETLQVRVTEGNRRNTYLIQF